MHFIICTVSCQCTFSKGGRGYKKSGRFTICRIERRSGVWAWPSCHGYHELVGSMARDVNTGREFPELSSGSG